MNPPQMGRRLVEKPNIIVQLLINLVFVNMPLDIMKIKDSMPYVLYMCFYIRDVFYPVGKPYTHPHQEYSSLLLSVLLLSVLEAPCSRSST